MPSVLSPSRPEIARLWRDWMRPHWRAYALAMAFIMLGALATAAYPLLIKRVFEAFEARDLSSIAWLPVLVVLVTAVKGGALYAQSVITNRTVTRIEADMQAKLYAHLVDADLARAGGESSAALTQRFTTDFAYIKEALTRVVTVLLRDLATVIALAATMFWLDFWLSLAALIIAPLVAGPIGRIGKKLRRIATATQEEIGAMAGTVSEGLTGLRVAKAFQLEGYLKQRARGAFEEVRRLKMKAANARAWLDPILEIGGGLAVALVIAAIGYRIARGQTSIADFIAFITALLMAAQPVRSIGNLNAIMQEAAAALRRYFATLDEVPKVIDRPDALPLAAGPGRVEFADVSFNYPGGAAALSGLIHIAEGGKTTALAGRSGSGKSTLLSLVPRLMDASGGAVRIDGQDIREVTLASLRASMALVSQDILLFDDSVMANIAHGRPDAGEAEIFAAAKAAAAHDFITALPEGYATRCGERGGRLSGGERQRIAIARAILRDPRILLLDEATSALDAESETLIQQALAGLMKGRTTIVIAHRLSTIRDADRIAVMEAGRIIETGSHAELLAAGGAYAKLHRLQFEGGGDE